MKNIKLISKTAIIQVNLGDNKFTLSNVISQHLKKFNNINNCKFHFYPDFILTVEINSGTLSLDEFIQEVVSDIEYLTEKYTQINDTPANIECGEQNK